MTAVADAAHLYGPSIVVFPCFFLSVSAFVDLSFARYNRLGASPYSAYIIIYCAWTQSIKSWVNKLVRDDNK